MKLRGSSHGASVIGLGVEERPKGENMPIYTEENGPEIEGLFHYTDKSVVVHLGSGDVLISSSNQRLDGINILDAPREKPYNPLRHLAQAFWLGAWRRGFVMPLTGYFDETGESTDLSQTANGLGGFLASGETWDSVADVWNTDFMGYHDKNYRGESRKEKRRKLIFDALENLPVLLPIAWITDAAKWNQRRAEARLFPDPFFEPYFCGYDYCLRMSLDVIYAQDSQPTEVATVFDEKVVFFDKAMEYYRLWKQREDPDNVRHVFPPVYRLSDDFAPLQAADFVWAVIYLPQYEKGGNV
jgi:hypothetical protein